jgi:plastocyanin
MLQSMVATLAAALVAVAVAPLSSQAPSDAIVHMHDFAFVPKTLVVVAGTRVTIVNDDDEAHTATAIDRSFDSAGLDAHESWSHVFERVGSFAYLCALHPYMKGLIVVRPRTTSKGNL